MARKRATKVAEAPDSGAGAFPDQEIVAIPRLFASAATRLGIGSRRGGGRVNFIFRQRPS
jgi:hypothetical protein